MNLEPSPSCESRDESERLLICSGCGHHEVWQSTQQVPERRFLSIFGLFETQAYTRFNAALAAIKLVKAAIPPLSAVAIGAGIALDHGTSGAQIRDRYTEIGNSVIIPSGGFKLAVADSILGDQLIFRHTS